MARSAKKHVEAPAPAEEAAAVYIDPKMLVPWKKNPKPLDPGDIRELARAIRRFGFGPPIVARLANNEIIAGHLRYAAAKRLKLEKVPVRFMDLSESEAHMMALADTKLGQRRTFVKKDLAEVMMELDTMGVDLEMGTGFSEVEADSLIGVEDEGLGGEDDEDRNFSPSSADAQGALDQKQQTCPKCKHAFYFET